MSQSNFDKKTIQQIKRIKLNNQQKEIIPLKFQEDVHEKMLIVDQSFKSQNILEMRYKYKSKMGVLNLDVGNGKTVLTCKRILHWLNHKLNLISDICPCNQLEDEIKTNGHDDFIFNSKRIGSIIESNKILVVVPSKIYEQWKSDMFSCLGEENFKNYVCFIHRKDQLSKACSSPNIKIILITYGICQSSIEFIPNVFDFVFFDEIHIFHKEYRIISNHLKSNFTWILTAEKFLNSSIDDKIEYNFYPNNSLDYPKDLIEQLILKLIPTEKITEFKVGMNEYLLNFIKSCVGSEVDVNFKPTKGNFYNIYQIYSELLKIEFEKLKFDYIPTFLKCDEMQNLLPDLFTEKIYYENNINNIVEIFPQFIDWGMIIDCGLVENVTSCVNSHIINLINKQIKECLKTKNIDHENKIKNLYEKQEELKKRLIEMCGICFETNLTPMMLPCCGQMTCVMCLKQIQIGKNLICPYCRGDLNSILTGNNDLSLNLKDISGRKKNLFCSLFDLTIKLINENPQTKILIVYNMEKNGEKLCTKFLTIKNSLHIKCGKSILKFQTDSKINCAYINSKLCNFGLNMAFVNNMIILNHLEENDEIQMIGRAQRFPRITQLNVYRFCAIRGQF
jgi:hypothetical protein